MIRTLGIFRGNRMQKKRLVLVVSPQSIINITLSDLVVLTIDYRTRGSPICTLQIRKMAARQGCVEISFIVTKCNADKMISGL